jgi:hypothetical protein
MITIKVSEEIITHCESEIEKHNFGQRGIADGTKEQQLTGIIGQSVVMELFGLGYVDGSKGFDNGVDIIYQDMKIDVKTMGRTTDMRDYYVHNFVGLQKDYNNDIYIFCSLNKKSNELTICGWLNKTELFEKANFFKKGQIRTRSNGTEFKTFSDLYEIDNNALHNVNSIEELKSQIANAKQ